MDFYAQLTLSMIIFAPGLILLTVCTVIGILMLLEKAGVLSAMVEKQEAKVAMADADEANPAPSTVVSGLKGAIASEDEVRKTGTK